MAETPIDSYVRRYAGPPREGVTKDVAFNRKSFGEDQPENPDQGEIYTGTDDIVVELVQDFDDKDLQKLFTFAINATRGIDPRNPPKPVDWEEMMKGGLQTALEDIRIAFAVYSVSRTMTHQTVRSRRAAFHQQSQRAHYYGDRPSVRMPESFIDKELAQREDWIGNRYAPNKVWRIDQEYARLAEHAAWFYRLATDADVSYQDARFALLEGTTNFILCEYSLREFIDVYNYRACSMFQWEIVYTMREMKRVLVEQHPWLERYVKISCEKTHGAKDGVLGTATEDIREGGDMAGKIDPAAGMHTCTFQGWESVEGQCDFPWARESNRTFRSDAHRIEKKS